MARLRRPISFLVGRPWIVIAVLVVLAVGFWVKGTRDQSHEVRAAFPAAVNLVPGNDVQVADVDVGKVTSIRYEDGKAIVGLGIDDERFWPLHHGTTATIRWGTTIGNATRRIVLEPGPESAPEIPEQGILNSEATAVPVEVDDLFNTFDARTRRHMQGMLTGAAGTFEGHEGDLNRGLRHAAPALESVGGVMRDLAEDQVALTAFVANSHRVTRALAAKRPQISDLISVASATFDEFATNSRSLQATLDEAPATFQDARRTLSRLDASVDVLDALVSDLRPGAARLRPLAAVARPAFAELRRIVPPTLATAAEIRHQAPAITRFLRRAAPFLAEAAPVLADLAPMLGCIRPYAPEIAGGVSNWASWTKNFDANGRHTGSVHLGSAPGWRAFPQGGWAPSSSRDFLETFNEAAGSPIRYALPRPPGLGAGRPWLLPECGAGPDALNPSKDPERLEE